MASTTTNKAVKQDLDPTQREFLALTQAQPKFTITLPLKSREAKENEADVRVQVNGVIWQIKRGAADGNGSADRGRDGGAPEG